MTTNKQRLIIGLKILVALALLSWFLAKSDIGQVFNNIAHLPLKIFLAAALLDLFYLAVKSLRWRLLLPQEAMIKLIKLSFIAQFYSLISAGQFVGEAAKIYILGKGQKQASQIAMSVLLDKITGIIGLVIVSVFGLILSPAKLPFSLIAAFASLALVCLIFIFLIRLKIIYNFLFKFFNQRLVKAVKLKKIIGWIIRLIDDWSIYSAQTRIMAYSILLSVIFQLMLVAVYMILASGLGINISFWDWSWLLGILSGLVVLPVTVGGLGLREGSLVGLLGFFKVAPEKALALSFSFFGVQLILFLIGGLLEAQRIARVKIKPPDINL